MKKTPKRKSLAERQRERLEGRPRGRPHGSAHREYLTNEVEVSACPSCHCTDRTPYEQPQRIILDSEPDEDGLVRVIILRRCRCLNCNEFRIDRCRELKAA